MERIKYITNKELLAEIDRSKKTYSSFTKPEYARYDAIVHNINEITAELLESTFEKRLEIVAKQGPLVWGDALKNGINPEDIVFRVMTNEHIPVDPTRKRRIKILSDEGQAKTPFAPFRHFRVIDGNPIEVGRSHWKGDFETGSFCIEQGKISNRLAIMFMLLVERYSKRGNWRSYCVDSSTEALTKRGWLKYNEITEDDIILSYDPNGGELKWSKIKSIYRNNDYNGDMFHLTVPITVGMGMDALVTPHHKFVTTNGLKEVEFLLNDDEVVLFGNYSSEYSHTTVKAENININGAKRNSEGLLEPNIPYVGVVWCPETEYGSFLARRNSCVYISGNTYVDEMRSHALLQLSQVGLQFDESKSDNPFSFFTQVIKNCGEFFTLLLTKEYGKIFIGEISGQDVHLLDGNKQWTLSHIYDHGVAETVNVVFYNGIERVEVATTWEHSWIEKGSGQEITTKQLVESFTTDKKYIINDLLDGNGWVLDDRQNFKTTIERVFCPIVPTTNSFALASGIHSHNCVAYDTMILTREYGSVNIGDVSEQDVHLLDGNGDWVKCHIHDHGIQETINVNFYGGFEKICIRSTMEHGWVEKDTKRLIYTKEFVENNGYNTHDVLIDHLVPRKAIENQQDYQRGVVHGLIYGDGTERSKNSRSFGLRVCSNHECIEKWLTGYSKTYPPSNNGDPQYYLSCMWCDLKALPENPGESLDYLLGFLRGWFATDGCVSKVPTPTICGDRAEYEWIKKWGPLVGWQVRKYTKLVETTNFGIRKKISLNIHLKKNSMIADDFLVAKHYDRWLKRKDEYQTSWRVYSRGRLNKPRQDFTRRQMERVYCPVVPTTHTFALSCGITTQNCFTRILNVERKNQHIRDDLLIIGGVQPSFSRQIDHEIESRFGDEQAINVPNDTQKTIIELPKKRGRKPKI